MRKKFWLPAVAVCCALAYYKAAYSQAPEPPKALPPAPPELPAKAASTKAATNKSPAPAAAPAPARDDRKAKAQARQKLADRTRPWRNELAGVEKRLAGLNDEKAKAETKLSQPSTPPSEMAELGRSLNHIAAEVAMQVRFGAPLTSLGSGCRQPCPRAMDHDLVHGGHGPPGFHP